MSTIVGILVDGASSPPPPSDEVEIVLDSTPFYAEGGANRRHRPLKVDTGAVIEIRDCQKPVPVVYVH
ncbi:hypothetical protein GCM10023238_27600 [Streptomyces heliomycini]